MRYASMKLEVLEMAVRFRDWAEATASGYLRRNEVRRLVIGYRYRPNGERVPVTLTDVGVSVRMLTHHLPPGGNYSVDGWEVALGEVRVRAVPIFLTHVENQMGGLGAASEMFRLGDLQPLIQVALEIAREKYGEVGEVLEG